MREKINKFFTLSIFVFLFVGCVSFFYKQNEKADAPKFQKLELFKAGDKWNGGKPSLPIQVGFSNGKLKVVTTDKCDNLIVQISGVDGVKIQSTEEQFNINCSDYTEFETQIAYDSPNFGIGYLVITTGLQLNGDSRYMTSAFEIKGKSQEPALKIQNQTEIIKKDQNGNLYRENKPK